MHKLDFKDLECKLLLECNPFVFRGLPLPPILYVILPSIQCLAYRRYPANIRWVDKRLPLFVGKQENFLEKAMAPHSSTPAWKIPWTEEPGGLQSMGLLRVGHDWETSLSLFTFLHWGRKWQSAPVLLPGEFQGWRSLVGFRLWGRTELDTTEAT